MPYQHIIWDWNGTLLDDAWLCVDITNGLLEARGLEPLDTERYQRLFDFPVRGYYERLGFDLEAESFEHLGLEFIKTYHVRRFECSLRKGVRTTLSAVAQAGLTQSILSAYEQNHLLEIATHFNLVSYFNNLTGLNDHYAAGKIEAGKHWLAQQPVKREHLLLVGDTVHDHEVASELGIDVLLIPCGHHAPERLKACGVPVLQTLPDTLHHLGLEELA